MSLGNTVLTFTFLAFYRAECRRLPVKIGLLSAKHSYQCSNIGRVPQPKEVITEGQDSYKGHVKQISPSRLPVKTQLLYDLQRSYNFKYVILFC